MTKKETESETREKAHKALLWRVLLVLAFSVGEFAGIVEYYRIAAMTRWEWWNYALTVVWSLVSSAVIVFAGDVLRRINEARRRGDKMK